MITPRWLRQLREEAQEGGDGGGGIPPVVPPAPPQDTELNALKARLAKLESGASPPAAPRPTPAPQPGQPVSKADLEKQFWANPLDTIQQAMGYAINAATAQNAPALEKVAINEIRQQDPEVWDALQTNIMAVMQDVAPQYRTNTTVWQNAFNQVRGENWQKVMDIKNKKTTTQGTADGPVPAGVRPPAAPAKSQLSAEEAKFAGKMKLTPEQYTQGKEFYDNQDKMWQGVITFDSDTDRRTVGAK